MTFADHNDTPADTCVADELASDNRDWLDLFTIELRLLDVSGSDIGDALASAREFLADSGSRADECFGTPQVYAAELALPALPQAKKSVDAAALRAAVGGLGLMLSTIAVGPALRGQQADAGPVDLAVIGGLLLAILLLPRYFPRLVRLPQRTLFVVGALTFLVPVLLYWMQGDASLFPLPAVPLVILAGLLLLLPAMWNQFRPVITGSDPIVEPVVLPATQSDPAREPHWSRAFLFFTNWMLVIAAAASVAFELAAIAAGH